MANLKFKDISWDTTTDKHILMYVIFDYNGREFKWYPKWKDVSEIFSGSWATESSFNQSKQMGYLKTEAIVLLLRYILIENDIKDWAIPLNNLHELLTKQLTEHK